ncbi:trypsin-like peptidase domain-containing protein [Silvimonas amylolytica]|uniref:DUF4124 domain-containing protein n=1 Tax=Silvimonas amylolytica TaxID=449663 RepID=A0ABQ2PKU9_9NEIS|nr:trypsin-like peptidase domain-containing protein [Silvimonas amylolytica]GGP25627.1 hypothetical protein GCM10010971_14460 [Silvimonas amylolytica]
MAQPLIAKLKEMILRASSFALLLCLALPAQAEIYKTRDANGNITFTDVDPNAPNQVSENKGAQSSTVRSTRQVTTFSRYGSWRTLQTSTVTVQTRAPASAAGSGFRVATNMIVTSKHLVHDCSRVMIDNNRMAMQVALSGESDLALIRDYGSSGSMVKFRKDEAHAGESVFVGGFLSPAETGDRAVLHTAKVQVKSSGADPHVFGVTGNIMAGAKGGPILDQAGHLIGLVSFNTNTDTASHVIEVTPNAQSSPAIKGSEITQFLKANSVEPLIAEANQPVEQTVIANNLEHAMVTITCYR